MAIRNLELFLKSRNLSHKSSISTLDDCRIAIDGHLWLRQLLLSFPQDFTTVAMGGVPLGLSVNIQNDLDRLKINKYENPFLNPNNAEDLKVPGWEAYEDGNSNLASSYWANSGAVQHSDILGLVFSIFHDRNIEYIRAPYSCWAQMAYMANKPLVHAIYGESELVFFDVDKIISDINFKEGTFNWFSREELMSSVGLNSDQLIDTCLLAGSKFLSTFPVLKTKRIQNFGAAFDLINQHRSGPNVLAMHADNPLLTKVRYVEQFNRIRYCIKYHVILNDEGVPNPLSHQPTPPDALDFLGTKLPNEFYYYLGQGLIGPDVMNYLTQGCWNETAPLCNGEFTEYHQLLDDLSPLRSQILYLATQHLNNYYKGREVVTVYWYDPRTHHTLNSFNDVQMPKLMTAKWRCEQAALDEEKARQKSKDLVDLSFVVRSSESESFLKLQADSPATLESAEQIVATGLMRFLEFRGLINLPQVSTTFGNTLIKALNTLPASNNFQPGDFIEELIVALELIRLGVLHNNPYSKEHSDPLLPDIAEGDKQHIRLISRVLSLLPVTFSSAPWVGPVDRNLLCFHSCVKLVYGNLRNVIEMTVLSIFLSKECKVDREDYATISLMLPFLQEANTALGVMAKTYLNKTCGNPEVAVEHWVQKNELPKLFPCCYNMKEELEKGFKFWDQLVAAVSTLDAEHNSAVVTAFKEADQWLSKRKF